jgi:hypothetical protein
MAAAHGVTVPASPWPTPSAASAWPRDVIRGHERVSDFDGSLDPAYRSVGKAADELVVAHNAAREGFFIARPL